MLDNIQDTNDITILDPDLVYYENGSWFIEEDY